MDQSSGNDLWGYQDGRQATAGLLQNPLCLARGREQEQQPKSGLGEEH